MSCDLLTPCLRERCILMRLLGLVCACVCLQSDFTAIRTKFGMWTLGHRGPCWMPVMSAVISESYGLHKTPSPQTIRPLYVPQLMRVSC